MDRRTALMALAASLTARLARADDMPATTAADLLAATGAPGCVVGRTGPDGVSVQVAGLRQVGGAPVAAGDPFHIGSLTKAMTATLIARLVQTGAMDWDMTASDVLGDRAGPVDPGLGPVRLTDLLTHRAGFGANLPQWRALLLADDRAGPALAEARLRYAAIMLSSPPEVPPGTFHYSNAGYVIAGVMAEVAAAASWEDLIATHVFTPLGMTGAGFGPPAGETAPYGHLRGILGNVTAIPPGPMADNIPAMGPAGTVHLPMAAMLRHLQAHASRPQAFLSPDNWSRLHTPPEGEPYAMGWNVTPDGHLTHRGSNTLWLAAAEVRPDAGTAAAVMLNMADLDAMSDGMSAALAAMLDAPLP
jgi:D-alanyl-D-alanine carboxypeptidase